MPRPGLDSYLKRWTEAHLIDAALAARLRAFEAAAEKSLNWPVLLATAFGALTLGAGVLLFVAAHWDDLSPAGRFSLVVVMVATFHGTAGSIGGRSPRLRSALHLVGTITLGAGIFLTGQIFNLQEHWPGGVLLWAIGAWAGWLLLREWPQALLAALLTPGWLISEWIDATEHFRNADWSLSVGVAALAIAYLTVSRPGEESLLRRSLKVIGAVALLPTVIWVVGSRDEYSWMIDQPLPKTLSAIGWLAAICIPLAVAFYARREAALVNVGVVGWLFVLSLLPAPWRHADAQTSLGFIIQALGPLLWECVGAVGLIAWGLRESSTARVNLGIAAFGLAILSFYFSELMDKMGRSASLIGLGTLLLLGGWMLEKTRRRLILKAQGATA